MGLNSDKTSKVFCINFNKKKSVYACHLDYKTAIDIISKKLLSKLVNKSIHIARNQKKSRCAESRDSPKRLGERYGEIEYRGGKVIQRWRGSSGNVRLSHLRMSFLYFLNFSFASFSGRQIPQTLTLQTLGRVRRTPCRCSHCSDYISCI